MSIERWDGYDEDDFVYRAPKLPDEDDAMEEKRDQGERDNLNSDESVAKIKAAINKLIELGVWK